MNIEQIMSKPAITCTPLDTLNTAAGLMWNNDCGVIPVVGEKGELVGMITDRDICMAAYTKGAALTAIPVSAAMATKVFSCGPQDDLAAAEALMGKYRVRRLAVVDKDRRPVGVLSLNDLARYACGAKKSSVEREEILRTLASICEPLFGSLCAATTWVV
jgi:CBS domain-containing protein